MIQRHRAGGSNNALNWWGRYFGLVFYIEIDIIEIIIIIED